jgi:hypothetical protein
MDRQTLEEIKKEVQEALYTVCFSASATEQKLKKIAKLLENQ